VRKSFASSIAPIVFGLSTLMALECHAGTQLVRLPLSEEYSNAAATAAITLACSETLDTLKDFFFSERVPFRTNLIRSQGGSPCHVFYKPTLPDFRAFPDDYPIAELMFNVDSLSFLATSTSGSGDSVSALEKILYETERSLRISISLPTQLHRKVYERAKEVRFGDLNHLIALENWGAESSLGWVQDYIKAGSSSRGVTVLVPHRIFEGEPANGPRYASLIKRLSQDDPRMVQSKLAWEGGDLQFTLDPKDPKKLVLYYGAAAKPYWGTALTPAEYEYVLTLEFGADRAVDLSGLAPHVDYFVSFLPRAKTALVSIPETRNYELALSAVERLLDRFEGRRQPGSLLELRDILNETGPIAGDRVRHAIDSVREDKAEWFFEIDHKLGKRIESFVEAFCPDRQSCFSLTNQERMIQLEPTLFSEWVNAARSVRSEQGILDAHLDLIASQINEVPNYISQRTRQKIGELEALGFRVVRVPALRVNMDQESGWPGVSYVNLLTVGDQLFLPHFGLGEAEDRFFEELARELRPNYSIVPVFARDILIKSGGLHCLAGIIRSPERVTRVKPQRQVSRQTVANEPINTPPFLR